MGQTEILMIRNRSLQSRIGVYTVEEIFLQWTNSYVLDRHPGNDPPDPELALGEDDLAPDHRGRSAGERPHAGHPRRLPGLLHTSRGRLPRAGSPQSVGSF